MDGTSHVSGAAAALDNDTNGSHAGLDRIDHASKASMDEGNDHGVLPGMDSIDHASKASMDEGNDHASKASTDEGNDHGPPPAMDDADHNNELELKIEQPVMDGTSHLSVAAAGLDNDSNGSQPGLDRIDHASKASINEGNNHEIQPAMDGIDHAAKASMDEGNDHEILPAVDGIDHAAKASMDEGDDHGPPPVMDDADHNNEVVILIVGNKQEDKAGVMESLTAGGEWADETTNDVRIRTCKSPARVIVDTTPLRNVQGKSPMAIARRWISRNSLRRIVLDKDVVVVCVLTGRVETTCQWDMFSFANCWVDVFGLIFKRHRGAIMILVNTAKKKFSERAVERFVLEHGFFTKNITYSKLEAGDEVVKGVIEDSISNSTSHGRQHWSLSSFDSSGPERWPRKWRARKTYAKHPAHSTVMPFRVGDALLDKEDYGPWGPERVILFGRAGSGKSTLAQMLTLGCLDSQNTTFKPHRGIRGGTRDIQPGKGRGWYVLDTPGFGETDEKASTITTRQVENKIKRYVKMVDGTFSHYLYVAKKDRMDVLEERLWDFFMRLFGEEIKQQFTVVIAGADEDWVQRNLVDLQNTFKGCGSFVSADFPGIYEQDEELENDFQEVRTESLVALEQELAKQNRADMECRYGKRSTTQLRMEVVRANVDLGVEKNERIKFLVRGASMIFACCNISHRPVAELTNLLKVNDRIALIPV